MTSVSDKGATKGLSSLVVLLALVTAGSVAVAVYVTLRGPDRNSAPEGLSARGTASAVPEFGVVVGNVGKLFPGASRPLPVTYTNPNMFPIKVTTATVKASLVSARSGSPACSEAYAVTGTYAGSAGVTVPKGASTPTTLPFGLKESAPDACRMATWKITVTAWAVKG